MWDFSDASTLFTDSTRTTPVSADGDPIGGVTDLSGAGNHLRQASGAERPLYKTGILDGRSAALYGGVSLAYLEVVTSPTYAQPNTVVVVGKHGTAENDRHFFDGSSTGRHLVGPSGGKWVLYAGSVLSGSAAPNTNNNIFVAVFNGASSKLWVNGGTADASGNAGAQSLGNGVAQGLHVGCDESAASSGRLPAASYVYAAYVFNAALSVSQINQLGTYVDDRWPTLTWTTAS